ncbi:2Fe-2S iron-sulfur cluster-binding protein [Nocardia sp. NPDC059228]|uniref:2Fe-2S iron-sulfur cluster-binding protein n=1 Tax=Nocardia sp. NPDC059228 TaxID=3346777 RepID=UPI00367D6B6F
MKITFTTGDGRVQTVDAELGNTVMHAAVAHNIPGITADCGGNAMCATCHVYVDEKDLPRLGAIADDEEEMLEFTSAARRSNSRLACQVRVDGGLDAISVEIPPESE